MDKEAELKTKCLCMKLPKSFLSLDKKKLLFKYFEVFFRIYIFKNRIGYMFRYGVTWMYTLLSYHKDK